MAFSPEAYGAARSLIEQTMAGAGAIKGQDGAPGKSAYEIAKDNGFDGTEQEWLDSMVGDEGKSAYEVAKDNGFDGTEEEWLQSLTMEKTLTLAEYEALSDEEKNNGVTYYIEDGDDEGSGAYPGGVDKAYVDDEITEVKVYVNDEITEVKTYIDDEIAAVTERANTTEQDVLDLDNRLTTAETDMVEIDEDLSSIEEASSYICGCLDGSLNPDDPTSGYDELANIRVGYDGTTYDRAGDAVREQISQLSGEIDDVCDIALLGLINVNDNYDAYNISFSNKGEIRASTKRCCVMYVDSETIVVPNDGYSISIIMTGDSGTTPDTKIQYFDGNTIGSELVWLKEIVKTPISDYQISVLIKSDADEDIATTNFSNYVNFYRNEKHKNVLVRGGFRTSEVEAPIKSFAYMSRNSVRTANKISDNVRNISVANGYFLRIVNISKTDYEFNVPIRDVTNIDLKSLTKQEEYEMYLVVYKQDNSVITETNFNDIVTFSYDNEKDIIPLEKRTFSEIKYVAAYDSTKLDKENADYVCDGVNDEVEIQQAIDSLTYGGTVYLLTGNYNIDGWNHIVTETINGTTYTAAFAIGITDRNQQTIRIKGQTPPLRTYGGKRATGTAIINFTSTALSKSEEYSLGVGIGYTGIAGTKRLYPKFALDIENIGFNLADNQHEIKVINAELFGEFYLRNFLICIDVAGDTDDTFDYEIPHAGCIGVRGLSGSNFGKGYRISNGFVFGMGVGYDLNGEHLIMEQCGVRYSKIPYRFGYNNKVGVNSHDLTLINCCHEGCIQGVVFENSQKTQSINFYDYNMEVLSSGKFKQTKKATETSLGSSRGNIFYTVNSDGSSYKNYFDTFFEDGHGNNFNVVCTTARRYGLSADRPTIGNPMQKYYCTDTKKETMYIPTEGWVEI